MRHAHAGKGLPETPASSEEDADELMVLTMQLADDSSDDEWA